MIFWTKPPSVETLGYSHLVPPGHGPNSRKASGLKIRLAMALVAFLVATLPVFGDTVTTSADSGPGSLRELLGRTEVTTIDFAVSQVDLTSEILIGHSVTIVGPDARSLEIKGNSTSRIFNISNGVTVVVSNLTIEKGRVNGANGLNKSATCDGSRQVWTEATDGSSAEGGAIYNRGILRLYNCAVANNGVVGGQGGSGNGRIPGDWSCCLAPFGADCTTNGVSGRGGDCRGGAIYNDSGGLLVLLGCTFSENSASAGSSPNDSGSSRGGGWAYGGAVYNAGQLSAANCTFSGNSASGGLSGDNAHSAGDGVGGAIENASSGTAEIISCTISGNSTAGGNMGECGCDGKGRGGGIDNGNSSVTAVYIKSTIVSANSGDRGWPDSNPWYPDVNGVFDSRGFNLIERISGTSGWTGSDLTGYNDNPKDALLGALSYNGGPTLTRLPQTNSPAINKGISSVGITTDQRGLPRTVILAGYSSNQFGGDYTDIGAVEVQTPPSVFLDIGLRVYDGTGIVSIACLPATTNTAFRVSKNGTTYGVVLTATNAADASKVRMKTSSGVKAWAKLP